MGDSPPDQVVNLDLTEVSLRDLNDYRRGIITALENPGVEFEVIDDATRNIYIKKLAEVDKYLADNFSQPAGGNEFSS